MERAVRLTIADRSFSSGRLGLTCFRGSAKTRWSFRMAVITLTLALSQWERDGNAGALNAVKW
jgi:hypothetical protein